MTSDKQFKIDLSRSDPVRPSIAKDEAKASAVPVLALPPVTPQVVLVRAVETLVAPPLQAPANKAKKNLKQHLHPYHLRVLLKAPLPKEWLA